MYVDPFGCVCFLLVQPYIFTFAGNNGIYWIFKLLNQNRSIDVNILLSLPSFPISENARRKRNVIPPSRAKI